MMASYSVGSLPYSGKMSSFNGLSEKMTHFFFLRLLEGHKIKH